MRREQGGKEVFCGRLRYRTGHRNHLPGSLPTFVTGELVVGGKWIIDPHKGAFRGRLAEIGISSNQSRRRDLEGRPDKLVAVTPRTRQGHEEVSVFEPTRIDFGADKTHNGVPLDRSTDYTGDVDCCHAHRALRTSVRTTSWSENGILFSPIV
jgi:hypothetical protein